MSIGWSWTFHLSHSSLTIFSLTRHSWSGRNIGENWNKNKRNINDRKSTAYSMCSYIGKGIIYDAIFKVQVYGFEAENFEVWSMDFKSVVHSITGCNEVWHYFGQKANEMKAHLNKLISRFHLSSSFIINKIKVIKIIIKKFNPHSQSFKFEKYKVKVYYCGCYVYWRSSWRLIFKASLLTQSFPVGQTHKKRSREKSRTEEGNKKLIGRYLAWKKKNEKRGSHTPSHL